jgi:DsbC/DsbD-like thiol-disulfide interchange protein
MNAAAFFFNSSRAIRLVMRFPPILLLIVLAVPASAGETPWQELAPGVRARLISSDVLKADGTTLVGIELDMPHNTKTYWRIPGETGIATELDFTGSAGIVGHSVLWPYPTVDRVLGYLDYVYYGPTVLPVVLAVETDAPAVELATTLGVCSDICVPAIARFSLPLTFEKADAGQGVRLDQAVALSPIQWDGADTAIGETTYDAATGGLTIPLTDPAIEPASLIADTGDPLVLFGTPQKSPDGNSVFLPLLGSVSADLGGQTIRITFMTDMGPYEISRQIRSASTESAN